MATSPRASAPTGTSGRGWTVVRPLGSRAVATSLATGVANEALVVQTFHVDSDGDRSGDPLRDARALANLRHTNVARIKEVVEKDGEVTIVSPFHDGETLAALRKAGPLPLAIELRILVDVLAGLAAVHGAKDSKLKPLGVVHGEVAPANVVIGTDGIPKVMQLAGVHANPGVQGADTLGYVAPEILLADDSFDQRVDVYSVGVMLWEALTGTTLFPETNAGAIVTRHLSGRIRKATLPADASWAEGLVEVAQKAIATDPSGRYASANELAAEIKRIAKTNVAPTMKVSSAVRERGFDAINARRTALGLAPLAGTGLPRPTTPGVGAARPSFAKPTPEPPKAVALAPAPTPAEALPTTKPVPSEEIFSFADDDDPHESPTRAVLLAPLLAEDPAVHERITSPPPAPEPAKTEWRKTEQDADFTDIALDSELPPGPPPRKGSDENFAIPPPAKVPVLTPVPPAAFAPSPFVAPSPVAPFAAPAESPVQAPISAPPEEPKKSRTIIYVALAVGALILIFGLRSCLSKPEPDTAAKSPPAATTPAKTAEPAPTLAADPATTATTATGTPPAATTEPAPTATATAEPTVAAKPETTAAPTATATAEPTVAAKPETTAAPTATNTGGGTKTAPPPSTATAKPKPKTYDPLGI